MAGLSELLSFYSQCAARKNLRKKGGKLYTTEHKYIYDVSDFVFHALYPIEDNRRWFELATMKANTLKEVIQILSDQNTFWINNEVSKVKHKKF